MRTFAVPLPTDELLSTMESVVGVADDVEIAVLARAGEYTRFAGGAIHQPQDITEVQYLVRAIVDGHACRRATTVAARLADTARAAAAAARARAEAVGAPGTADVAGPRADARTAPVWFDDVALFDTGVRVGAARDAMAAAAAFGGTAAGMFGRAVTQQAVVTSRGLRRATVATEASGALTVQVGNGTAHWIDLSRSADRLGLGRSVSATVEQAVAGSG